MSFQKYWIGILSAVVLMACGKDYQDIVISPEDYHASVDKVGAIMVHDIFSPPVASRVFAYPNVAAYEIMAKNNAACLLRPDI